jgi:hypothetical protein
MVVCGRTRTDASASNPHPFPRYSVPRGCPRGCPRNYGLACQKANSDNTSWTTTEKWLNREVRLDDGTGFTRWQCTTMRKLCRPSGGFNTHVLGLLPSHSEYRTRSPIVLCSIIYPFARWLFLFVLLRDRRISDSNTEPSPEGNFDDSKIVGSVVIDSERSGFTFITARVMSSHCGVAPVNV